MRHHRNSVGIQYLVRIRGCLALLVALLLTAGMLRTGPAAAATHQDQMERAASLGAYSSDVLVAGRDGSASLTQPLRLPAARGRWQPSLALTYSSNSADGPEGVGWTLSGSWIERATRSSPDADSGEPRVQYRLVRDGTSTQLLPVDGQQPGEEGRYRPEVQAGFVEARLHPGVYHGSVGSTDPWWELADGLGTRLRFSLPNALHLAPRCVAWDVCTRWYLSDATDVDGNNTVYDYTAEPSAIPGRTSPNLLLSSIRYNRFTASAGAGEAAYATEVRLHYEPLTSGGGTSPPTVEAVAGGLVLHDQRLTTVQELQRSTPEMPLTPTGGWQLTYDKSPDTARGLLTSLQMLGRTASLTGPRPTQFAYTPRGSGASLDDAAPIPPPAGPAAEVNPSSQRCGVWLSGWTGTSCSIIDLASWLDLDGDRRPDLVWGGGSDPQSHQPLGLRWARNLSTPGRLAFAPVHLLEECVDPACQQQQPTTYSEIVSASHPTGETTTRLAPGPPPTFASWTMVRQRLLDINGDGRPDLVSASGSACAPQLTVRFALGTPSTLHYGAATALDTTTVAGAADRSGTLCHLIPDGARPDSFGLSSSKQGRARGTPVGPNNTLVDLADVTGDGLPDFVVADPDLHPPGQPSSSVWAAFPLYQAAGSTWRFARARNLQVGSLPIRQVDQTGSTRIDLADLNGDGFADRLDATAQSPSGTAWTVAYGDGTEFTPAAPWISGDPTVQAIAQAGNPAVAYDDETGDTSPLLAGVLTDINGDGRPDYVYKSPSNPRDCPPPPPCPIVGNCPAASQVVCPFLVSINTGAGFAASKAAIGMPHRPRSATGDQPPPLEQADLYPYGVRTSNSPAENGTLLDVDGDGQLDYINTVTPSLSPSTAPASAWWWYHGRTAAGLPGTDLLVRTTSPLGARTDLTYAPSTRFTASDQTADHSVGRITPVLVRNSLCGPALDPPCPADGTSPVTGGTRYWYANFVVAASPFDPARPELRGYSDTWTQDPAGIVTHTVAITDQHALAGFSALVARGTPSNNGTDAEPPGTQLFETIRTSWAAHLIGTRGCVVGSAPSGQPIVPVPEVREHTILQDGVAFTSRESVDCASVDDNGHIGARTIDPDTSITGDERIETTSYDPTASHDPTAACVDCPTSTESTAPSTGKLLAHASYHYAPTPNTTSPVGVGHLSFVQRQASLDTGPSRNRFEIAERLTYNADGTIASREQADSHVTTRYRYDRTGLHTTDTFITNGHSSLETKQRYDPATGNLTEVEGPFTPDSRAAHAGQAFTYDPFGRLASSSRLIFTSTAGSPTPTITRQLTRAIDYRDTAVPAEMLVWKFAVPPTAFTPGQATPDDIPAAQLTITYLDALGRPVQQRQRLAGPPDVDADRDAHLVDQLDPHTYRVSGVVLYDSAGRSRAALGPFYATGAAYQDYWQQPNPDGNRFTHPQRTVTNFDRQGRPVCTVQQPATWPAAPTDQPCTSNFTDGPSHRLATASSYSTAILNQHTYLAVRTIPARANTSGGGWAATQFQDAAGRLVATQDPYDNTTQVERDPLGRVTASVRQAATHPATTTLTATTAVGRTSDGANPVRVRATTAYDLLGRIIRQDDPSFGTRVYRYLASGQLTHIGMGQVGMGPGQRPDGTVAVDYQYTSLGRLTRTLHTQWQKRAGRWQAHTTTASILAYDTPYHHPTKPASGGYDYTAGRISWAVSPATTIAFGYDPDGNTTRRDQWFGTDPARHTVTRRFGNDDRLLGTTITLPGLDRPASYDTDYDSAGRPVRLYQPRQVWWHAADQAPATGAYDPLGRLAKVIEDNGNVTTTGTYSAFTQLPTSQRITLPGGPVYEATGLGYTADKLTSATDPGSGSMITIGYDHAGRLARWQNTARGPHQMVTEQFSASLNKTLDVNSPDNPSLGNLERVVTISSAGISQRDYRYDVEGHPDQITQVVTTGLGARTDNYRYDDRGLLVAHMPGGDHYDYDAEARLSSITSSTSREHIGYGPFGNVAERSIQHQRGGHLQPAMMLRYIGDDATVSSAANTTPSDAEAHVRLGGIRIASIHTNETLYYHRDRLGSVVATSRNGGRPGITYHYNQYGTKVIDAGASLAAASDLGYIGALTLTGGLVHLQARDYDPSAGRFLQADNLQLDRYTYAGGDPTNHVDPSGHRWEDSFPTEHSWNPWTTWMPWDDGGLGGGGETGGSDEPSGGEPGSEDNPIELEPQTVDTGSPDEQTGQAYLPHSPMNLPGFSIFRLTAGIHVMGVPGPYHPPTGVGVRCYAPPNDSCSSWSLKINYLKHTIQSHIVWDVTYPEAGNPHAQEIANLKNALNTCIGYYTTFCTNQPQWFPVVDAVEQPVTENQDSSVLPAVGIGAGAAGGAMGVWWGLKALSPVCGPALPLCAVAL